MKVEHTERGFERIDFADANGENCSLQESSVATKPLLWLGVNDTTLLARRMHLNREQVEELVLHLQAWLATGSFDTSCFS